MKFWKFCSISSRKKKINHGGSLSKSMKKKCRELVILVKGDGLTQQYHQYLGTIDFDETNSKTKEEEVVDDAPAVPPVVVSNSDKQVIEVVDDAPAVPPVVVSNSGRRKQVIQKNFTKNFQAHMEAQRRSLENYIDPLDRSHEEFAQLYHIPLWQVPDKIAQLRRAREYAKQWDGYMYDVNPAYLRLGPSSSLGRRSREEMDAIRHENYDTLCKLALIFYNNNAKMQMKKSNYEFEHCNIVDIKSKNMLYIEYKINFVAKDPDVVESAGSTTAFINFEALFHVDMCAGAKYVVSCILFNPPDQD